MKKRFILVSSLVFIFCLAFIGLVFAADNNGLNLNVEWPSSPVFNTSIDATTEFDTFIKYIYEWSISLAILSVFIILVYNGVKYMTSVGAPKQTSEAMSNIQSAVFGLVLLLGSWLILNTINPQLTSLKIPDLTSNAFDLNYDLTTRQNLPPCYKVEINGKKFVIDNEATSPRTILVNDQISWTDLLMGPLNFLIEAGKTALEYFNENSLATYPEKIKFFRKKTVEECINEPEYIECKNECYANSKSEDCIRNNCGLVEDKNKKDVLNTCLDTSKDENIKEEPGSCYVEFWGASSWFGYETEACGTKIGQVGNSTEFPGAYLTEGSVRDVRCIQIHANNPLKLTP